MTLALVLIAGSCGLSYLLLTWLRDRFGPLVLNCAVCGTLLHERIEYRGVLYCPRHLHAVHQIPATDIRRITSGLYFICGTCGTAFDRPVTTNRRVVQDSMAGPLLVAQLERTCPHCHAIIGGETTGAIR